MKRRFNRLSGPLLACLLAPLLLRAEPLPPEIERALTARHIPASSVSVFVQEIGAPTPLLSHNADVPRNPASTMKVLTTYAALELLGPAYIWRTRAYAVGSLRDNVLDGDLVIEGGGDPFMTADRWWGFINAVRQAGVDRIKGDIVLDTSYFAPQNDDRAAFDNRPYRVYNVVPDALTVNFQSVNVSVAPDAAANKALVRLYPWPANLTVDNELRLERGCRGTRRVVIASPDGAAGKRLSLAGSYGSGCAPIGVQRAVMSSPDFTYGTFRSFWQQSGGTIDGGMKLAPVPPNARLLTTYDSLSLAEVIRLVNKFSSNVMARTLLLTLAAEKAGRPGTTANGQRVVVDFLTERGIAMPGLVIENGSGLSRIARVTAAGLGGVLLDAWRSPYSAEFQASLPLSAVDGTLRRRFRNGGMEGRVRMKTGSLEDVSALAGYVSSASGRNYVAVIIVNHPGADDGPGDAVQTAMVNWLYSR